MRWGAVSGGQLGHVVGAIVVESLDIVVDNGSRVLLVAVNDAIINDQASFGTAADKTVGKKNKKDKTKSRCFILSVFCCF